MENIYPNIVFDHCISLGYYCDVANALMYLNYRDASYPFDWCFTKISKIKECFNNKFENFFNKENLIRSTQQGNPSMDKDGSITYVHDGSYRKLMQDENFFNKQKNKYIRRINRLYDKLNSKKNILFILVCNHYNHNKDNIDEINELINCINEKKFNCNLKFLIITNNDNKKVINHYSNSKKNLKMISLENIYNKWNIRDVISKVNAKTYKQVSRDTWNSKEKYII